MKTKPAPVQPQPARLPPLDQWLAIARRMYRS